MAGIKTPLTVDKEGGTKALNDWLQEEVAKDPKIPVKVGLDEKATKQSAAQVEQSLKAIGTQGQAELGKLEAGAKGTKDVFDKIFDVEKTRAYAKGLQAAKAALGTINDQLHLVNDNQKKAVDQTVGLAEDGVKMGAAFGPWGALIGGALGAITSIVLLLKDWLSGSKEIEESNGIIDRHTGHVAHNIEEAWGFAREAAESVSPMVEYWRDIKENTKGWGTWLGLAVEQVKIVADLQKLTDQEGPVGEKKKTLQDKKDEYAAAMALGKLYETQHATGAVFDAEDEANAQKTAARIVTARADLKAALDEEVQGHDKAATATDKHTEAIKGWTDATEIAAKSYEAYQQTLGATERKRLDDSQAALDNYNQYKRQEDAKAQADGIKRIQDEAKAGEDAANAWLKKREDTEREAAKIAEELQKKTFDQTTAYFETALGAVEAVTGKLYANIEAGNKAFAGFGEAVKKGISDALKALGKQFEVKAIGEAAEALASLAFQDYAGAAKHAAAALGFEAASLAAGIGGALAGRSAAASSAATSSSSSPSSSGGGGFSGSAPGTSTPFTTQQLTPIQINLYAPLGLNTEREKTEIGQKLAGIMAAYNGNGGGFTS